MMKKKILHFRMSQLTPKNNADKFVKFINKMNEAIE